MAMMVIECWMTEVGHRPNIRMADRFSVGRILLVGGDSTNRSQRE